MTLQMDRLRRNLPTDSAIEGLLQDMAELCNSAGMNLNVTDDNATDWYEVHRDMDALYDRLKFLHASDAHGTSPAIGV